MKKGLRAYWLRIKQMPHKFEFEVYQDTLAAEASSNTVKPILTLDGGNLQGIPGIIIPTGNWTL
jgi:hypothetical protein